MNERSGFKKDAVLIVGSSHNPSEMARLHEMTAILQQKLEDMEIAMIEMGEAGLTYAQAGTNLTKAMKAISCPEEMKNITMPDLDFSRLENIVLDSITPINNGFQDFYGEGGPISKKAWKKLSKKQQKRLKQQRLEQRDQKEIWANKWNHKIKRKL